MSRPRFAAAAGWLAIGLIPGAFIPGCRPLRSTGVGAHAARLAARPTAGAGAPPPAAGPRRLDLTAERDALLYVPAGSANSPAAPRKPRKSRPLPLLVLFHGAGGDAAGGMSLLSGLADRYGVALLSPASRSGTWDAIRGTYEADVVHLDAALEAAFSAVEIDPDRIGVGGFSDGASYALGLGLANGDLFGRIIAFSPGFIPGGPRHGKPDIFLSHGRGDDVLPIRSTSRKIVPALERDGYGVKYREFDGGHSVPPLVARESLEWLGW